MAKEAIISLEHVDAGYPRNVILHNVSFDVKEGEIFILLGGSGCGKSTILKHMIGLNPILTGKLTICGSEWSAKTAASLYRQIGVSYQSGALFGSMTCLENVMLPLEAFTKLSRRARCEKARQLLAEVELADAAEKMPSEISGGMKKRVAIARALALEPKILFFDEPSAGLDPITAFALDQLILRLRREKGTTFVIVTHELASIFRIADRCALFDKARRGLVALGNPRVLREKSTDAFARRFLNGGEENGK